jgi:hypothetical protein
MKFARRLAMLTAGLALAASLAGCNVWQDKAEFAAPQSRWPETLPGAVAADAPPPPRLVVHCYRTLAIADCYTAPHPERAGTYTGSAPTPNSAP